MERLKRRVERATIHLAKMGGQGVLVPGGYILTAAHRIEWSGTGGMVLGDYFLERIETMDGRSFRLAVASAEPVTDLAVLGEPDSQEFYADLEAFEGVLRGCRAGAAEHPHTPVR